jgi:hypothetical protein
MDRSYHNRQPVVWQVVVWLLWSAGFYAILRILMWIVAGNDWTDSRYYSTTGFEELTQDQMIVAWQAGVLSLLYAAAQVWLSRRFLQRPSRNWRIACLIAVALAALALGALASRQTMLDVLHDSVQPIRVFSLQ